MRERLLIYAGLLYVIVAWALNTIFAKDAFAWIDPIAFTFVRFLCMTPLAFLLARWSGSRIHIERRDILTLLACGACGFGVYQYFWIIGLAHTTPFASALLGAMAPIVTLAIVAALGLERVRSGRWTGAVIALCGIAIFEGALSGNMAFRLGDILTLCGAIAFALYNVVSSRLLARYTPLELLALSMTIGTLILAPAGVPAVLHTHFATLPWGLWWRLVYAILFPVLLTYPVWTYGLSRLGAGKASIFSFLTPVFTGVFSVAFAHAHFTGYQLIGGIVTIAGMMLSYALGSTSLGDLWAARTLPMER